MDGPFWVSDADNIVIFFYWLYKNIIRLTFIGAGHILGQNKKIKMAKEEEERRRKRLTLEQGKHETAMGADIEDNKPNISQKEE